VLEQRERLEIHAFPRVDEQQAAKRLSHLDRPADVLIGERRRGARQGADSDEDVAERMGVGELLDAVLDVDRVDEGLDETERLGSRLTVARIWKHVRGKVPIFDTTVARTLESTIPYVEEPSLEQTLEFCAAEPVERVFLHEAARRGLGRILATIEHGRVTTLCHFGANVVPSGEHAAAFADAAAHSRARMMIGDERAVGDLWAAARARMPSPREDRPAQPVFAIDRPPEPGGSGLREATRGDLDLLLPASAATHEGEIGVDPLLTDPEGFRRRTLQQIDEGRSWVWIDAGLILFKAEASAWTPDAVQLQQVWVDPDVRNQGYGRRGLSDLIRLLLERVPRVCLFVRADNPAAIRLYEAVGMERAGYFRSLLF
jgi:ribosomal protein S18 acetylase RimI-like enzyme